MATRIRILGLLLLLLVGATSVLAVSGRQAIVYYYTDSTYTEQCGYRLIACDGIYESGCRTSWFTVEELPDC